MKVILKPTDNYKLIDTIELCIENDALLICADLESTQLANELANETGYTDFKGAMCCDYARNYIKLQEIKTIVIDNAKAVLKKLFFADVYGIILHL